jgi:uroporphyrinogen decarboxylase
MDRPPVALWRHFPVDDQSPDALAAATLNFQQTYDFDLLRNYSVQVINWHDRETYPSLKEAQAQSPSVVCGGLRRWDTMVLGTREQVTAEVQDAVQQTLGQHFILGTGCVLPTIAPHGNIMAARRSIENVS